MKQILAVLIIVSMLSGAGCSPARFRKNADREVYRAIEEKTPGVPGMTPRFSIERDPAPPLKGADVAQEAPEFLGESGQAEVGARVLTLERALKLAVTHSRSYQDQKEALYLQALSLTMARHQFAPIFSGSVSGDYVKSASDTMKTSDGAALAQAIPDLIGQRSALMTASGNNATAIANLLGQLPAGSVPPAALTTLRGAGQLTGGSAQLLSSYANLVEASFTAAGLNQPKNITADERSLEGQTELAVNLLLKGGTEIAAGVSSDFLRYLTGDPRIVTQSRLWTTLSQPLLRGRGKKIAMESLKQAERDLLYQLREFTRFRKEFAVRVASDYYGVIQDRDTARNNWSGYQAFVRAFERERARAAEGRITQADLGRSEQAMLSAEDKWFRSVRLYKQNLDVFKVLLGLPADEHVIPDDEELVRLGSSALSPSALSPEESIEVGLAARLDLYTFRDRAEDAERNVVVAANALKPQLDLVLSGTVNSVSEDDAFSNLDWKRSRWSAGFDLDLPFDRKSERNNYRAALIAREQTQRDLDLAVDTVKLDIRDAWRSLQQAERTLRIQEISVRLNERRVEEQNLLADMGRATVLDLIDAQNDLVFAQNELTAAKVNQEVAQLSLWRDMGILFIKEDGQWEDVQDAGES